MYSTLVHSEFRMEPYHVDGIADFLKKNYQYDQYDFLIHRTDQWIPDRTRSRYWLFDLFNPRSGHFDLFYNVT